MKKEIYFVALLLCTWGFLSGQTIQQDSTKSTHQSTNQSINLKEVVITVNRLPIALKNNPGAISLITPETLTLMPKGIGAEEALHLVPGVRIDNQHDGERVHISIRGQGILTERGLRGIGVIIDGIPVNDPSGFAPDLYDVDWGIVKKIEVLRGPAAGLYGSGGAAGVIDITTNNGRLKPIGGALSQSVGSNGFTKTLLQIGGSKKIVNYHVSFSRTRGNGYRDHQGFWGNNLYEKINFHPSHQLSITQIISHTDYFQQNPEGLNLQQLNNPRQANPDARPFNEYQKTNRTTMGVLGFYKISRWQDIEASTYLHSWNYKETSNRSAAYRTISNPGASIQYNIHFGTKRIKNNISIGSDVKWQTIQMYQLKSKGDPLRVESMDETNLETDTLLANQVIAQSSLGAFAFYKLGISKFHLLGSLRYDAMNNELTNKMVALDTAKTSKNFTKVSARIGISYSFDELLTAFADWSQGFMPPSTEELANNPVGYSGFNTHLVPATSHAVEMGFRGFYKNKIYYELTGFLMNTKNDFFRFKQTGRGNQEVFYGNAGNSHRNGVEAFVSFKIMKNVLLQMAYTFADYKYTSATVDPVYTDTTYVLTTPPAAKQWIPNSPKHQLYSELIYSINQNFKVSVGTEYQSKWAIYTDAKVYSGKMDPTIYQNWQQGFNLYNARVSYQWNIWGLTMECSLFVRNFTGAKYMAFTEPDPDGNSYQPGPGREFFGKMMIRF